MRKCNADGYAPTAMGYPPTAVTYPPPLSDTPTGLRQSSQSVKGGGGSGSSRMVLSISTGGLVAMAFHFVGRHLGGGI